MVKPKKAKTITAKKYLFLTNFINFIFFKTYGFSQGKKPA